MVRKLMVFSLTVLLGLTLVGGLAQAQGGSTPEEVYTAAIAAQQQAIPGVGRPDRWRHLILSDTYDTTDLGCPGVTGTSLGREVVVYKVWLVYEETGLEYVWHVSRDGTVVQACDSKLPGFTGGETEDRCLLTGATYPVYQQPLTTAQVLYTLDGSEVELISRSLDSRWYQLSGGGWVDGASSGFANAVSGDCAALPLTNTSSGGGTGNTGTACVLTLRNTNVRAEPTTESATVDTLTDTTANAVGRTGDNIWFQIAQGWVAAAAVQGEEAAACSQLPVTGATVTDYSACPTDFAGYTQSRMVGATQGQVETGSSTPNNVRRNPTTTAPVEFQMQPGTEFAIIGGPQCGNGIVWWQIQNSQGTGWTAESDAENAPGEYFLEPVGPVNQPGTGSGTSTGNGNTIDERNASLLAASQTQQIVTPEGAHVVWSADGTLLAATSVGGVVVYNSADLTPVTTLNTAIRNIPAAGDPVTAMAFTPDDRYLVLGYGSGVLRLVDVSTANFITLQNGHGDEISAIDFSGVRMVTASGFPVFTQPDSPDFSLRVWDLTTLNTANGSLTELFRVSLGGVDELPFLAAAFTPDGERIVGVTPVDVRVYDNVGTYIANFPRDDMVMAAARMIPFPASIAGGGDSMVLFTDGSALRALDVATGQSNVYGNTPQSAAVETFFQAVDMTETRTIVAFNYSANTTGLPVLSLFTANSGSPVRTDELAGLRDVRFNPDGTALAVLTESDLQVWTVQ